MPMKVNLKLHRQYFNNVQQHAVCELDMKMIKICQKPWTDHWTDKCELILEMKTKTALLCYSLPTLVACKNVVDTQFTASSLFINLSVTSFLAGN